MRISDWSSDVCSSDLPFAFADELIATAGTWVERRAGHGEDLAALVAGEARGDQRAGALRRLDHHDAQGEAGNQPVAAREVARLRDGAERHLGGDGAVAAALGVEIRVLRRKIGRASCRERVGQYV